MAQRKLQEFDEYVYGPRSVLRPGDQFRVGGGSVYVTDDGVEHAFAERGLFKFRRYCEQGAQKWIEAYPAGGGGVVLLWVGKACSSPVESNLKRKPYKIRKVTDRKREPKKARTVKTPTAAAGRGEDYRSQGATARTMARREGHRFMPPERLAWKPN